MGVNPFHYFTQLLERCDRCPNVLYSGLAEFFVATCLMKMSYSCRSTKLTSFESLLLFVIVFSFNYSCQNLSFIVFWYSTKRLATIRKQLRFCMIFNSKEGTHRKTFATTYATARFMTPYLFSCYGFATTTSFMLLLVFCVLAFLCRAKHTALLDKICFDGFAGYLGSTFLS